MNKTLNAAVLLIGTVAVSAVALADPAPGPYAGSNEAGSQTAAGSVATVIAGTVGLASAAAAVLVGNTNNSNSSSSTTTTK